MAKRKSEDTHGRHKQLTALGKDAHVSQQGIWRLLGAVEEQGLPEAYSRATQYRARRSVCQTSTPYGNLVVQRPVVLKAGGSELIAIQNPLAMLHNIVETSAAYSSLLKARLLEKPCTPASPWNIVLYQDGVDPSDGLAKNHSRKCVVFYWTFLELGMAALAHEEAWHTIAVVRVGTARRIAGEHVQLADVVLRTFFGPEGHDILRSGIVLPMVGGPARVTMFAKLGIILADEPALKEIMSAKGHAGTKPCMLCANVVQQRQPGGGEPLHAHSDYAVSIAETDASRFRLHTDESLRAAVRKLHAYKGVLAQEELQLREQLFGFNWNPHNLLLNERLRLNAVSCWMFDWAHCYVCGGIADVEFGTFVKSLHTVKRPTTYKELGRYLAPWAFPKAFGKLDHLFSEPAIKTNLAKGSFSCTASEFITMTPVLAR